ncbi:hypothetical protein OBB00_07880 [Gammaproteobacteria bacterium]|nr:hypothetical protein [Gammaproteobacteria bacterium]
MPTKVTNPTNIKAISQHSAVLTFKRNDDEVIESFSLDLSSFQSDEFPEDGALYVKINYRDTREERYDLGTVAAPSSLLDEQLDGAIFKKPNVVLNLKHPTNHKILGTAILVENRGEDSKAESILPIRFVDLGERIWSLDAPSGELPVLELNKKPGLELREMTALTRFSIVTGALMKVLRLFLEHQDDGDDWLAFYRSFASNYVEAIPPASADEDDKQSFIDDVLNGLSAEHGFASKVIEAMGGSNGVE